MKNKTLVLAAIMAAALIAVATTALPVAFADESETDTEIESEQENSCSGFDYTCQGQVFAGIGLPF